ncbi:nucleoside phosphorylase domain-containing protein [Phaeosphaeriaceae sp. PMI808]|nr:nucleoside phosphorylase domain-containing protein [Phaeosphaeriaceae sp. PMI808]
MARQLRRDEYTVGWVCALPVELAAAQEMLDEEHHDLEHDPADNDENLYVLGSIGGHNVVIVCLPAGRIGNNPAAVVATQLRATFKAIRFALMVGIGGGVPSAEADIRLGDVVVSQPHQTFAGVVQYDSGKATLSGFERIGSLNSPPHVLLSAVAKVRANELRGQSQLSTHASKLQRIAAFQRAKAGSDVLFEAAYDHGGGLTCDWCSVDRQKARQPRESEEEVVVHYGTIASGNQVMRSAAERDKVSAELGGVLCFEMEAAGLMNSFPCLVVRGICDYADSHKNKQWQPYAAATAAAYAKWLLSAIPTEIVEQRTMREATNGPNYSIYPEQPDLNAAPADLVNWQESVVDLLKVLDLNCDERFREWLAKSLHIRAGPSGSEKQNNALHKAIMEELAAGEIEWREIMKFRLEEGRCLNCGRLGHWECRCAADCGKCLYHRHKASECGYPVRCIKCRKLGHMIKDCSYTDSHKSKRWQPYAVTTAAAWSKEVPSVVPPAEVAKAPTVEEAMKGAGVQHNDHISTDFVDNNDVTERNSQPSSPKHYSKRISTIPSTVSHTHGLSNMIWSSTGKG